MLAIVSALTIAIPSLSLFALLSFIGIPIAVCMMVAPSLFIFLSLTGIFYRLTGQRKIGWIVGSLVALVVMAIPPLFINAKLNAESDTLVAQDHDDLKLPLTPYVIDVRFNFISFAQNKDGPSCEDFCLRVLLTGRATEVVWGI